jgi:hypothetical protein
LGFRCLLRQATRQVKIVSLAGILVALVIVTPIMLLFAFQISAELYTDIKDYFLCDRGPHVLSDEKAIDAVQNFPEVILFLKDYPDVGKSEAYLSKRQDESRSSNSDRGFWYVARETKFPYHEVVTVGFIYKFVASNRMSLEIECSMRACNPHPDCFMGGP